MIPGLHEGFICPIIENPDESKIEEYKIVETDPPVVIMNFQTRHEMLDAYRNYCRNCAIQRLCRSKQAQGSKRRTLTANDLQFLSDEEIREYFPEQ